MNLADVVEYIKKANENIFLIYAFNGTGKTRLSVEYKDKTKTSEGYHTGVYYNSYSEDLFRWNNDEDNDNENIRLEIVYSSLSDLHKYFGDESPIKEKLKIYRPAYDFRFKYVEDDPEKGIEYICFFKEGSDDEKIKISRGEERIFVWCFFLALFDLEDFPDAHKDYIFIDDPVSSLDETNIYRTATTLFELMGKCIENNSKLVVSTHHIGLFSILIDWLGKGENASKFKSREIKESPIVNDDGTTGVRETIEEKNRYEIKILEKDGDEYELRGRRSGAWLYHLLILQKLKADSDRNELYFYHFGMLRQVLETIASFVGEGRFGAVLNKIGEPPETVNQINAFSHKKVYDSQNAELHADNKDLFKRILNSLITIYGFKL